MGASAIVATLALLTLLTFDAFGVRGCGSKMGPQAAPLSRLAHFCYIGTPSECI